MMIDIIVALTFWHKSHCEVSPGEIPGHYDLVLPIPNSWKPCLNTSVLINVSIPSQASVLGRNAYIDCFKSLKFQPENSFVLK